MEEIGKDRKQNYASDKKPEISDERETKNLGPQ